MLYIHIPFCDSKCFYCAFNSYTNKNHLKSSYFEALKIDFLSQKKDRNYFHSIFIGGGTPSTMNLEFYDSLFKLISPYINNQTEITIEANPNSTNINWLKYLKNLGINRISFGVQSFDEEKLKFLGRNHSPQNAINSIENAHKVGFENINLDLIYSTKLDNKTLLKKDLEIALSLDTTHISAYSLTIEKNTDFAKTPENKKDDEDLELFFIDEVSKYFKPYEISNYGRICKHNLGYWEFKKYIGIGSGAVGFDGEKRIYKSKNVEEYIKNPTNIKLEILNDDDFHKEKVLLGFRSIVGVDKTILNKNELEKAYILIKENQIYEKEGRFFSKDFLLADSLTLFIIE